MGQRINLHGELCALDSSIRDHVYYQPPTGFALKYPCIVYKLSDKPTLFANDKPYGWTNVYEITYISRNPDDSILDSIGLMRGCKFDKSFVNDNLYHYVYTIHY